MESVFKVNGKTFFPIGGQAHNSSADSPKEMARFWRAMELSGSNTAEVPLYWDMIEAEEGKFDFTTIDDILKDARAGNFKVILLWFGTWKNGVMNYTPEWVKTNTKRFNRVISHDGAPLFVLSTHCEENLKADCKAFSAVMKHIHEVDDKVGTVIGMQVENEPGILGRSYRDHGPDGEKDFKSLVPVFIVEGMKKKASGREYEIWQKNGAKFSGTWSELFGLEASEMLTAYSIAKYIDTIVGEGKKMHNIPMIVNVWLDKLDWELPGLDYPCGGAEEKVINIWKWTTKYIDIIGPDLHKNNTKMYCRQCAVYDREDNALFVPESGSGGLPNTMNMFYCIGTYNAIGYFVFGLEDFLLDDNTINPNAEALVGNFKALAAGLPLLTKYRGTGRIHPIVQEEFMANQQLRDLDNYDGLVLFDSAGQGNEFGALGYVGYRYRNFNSPENRARQRGRGLVIQTADNEFYALGSTFALFLREKHGEIDYSEENRHNIISPIIIEEGHFDADEKWVCDRRRNGDEGEGIWVFPECGVVRVVMCK